MQVWKLIADKLVVKNCLLFGNNPKFTSKKVTKYLLGARETIEIFKLYELRYLLLKIYPLIHNLFHQARQNSKVKFKDFELPGAQVSSQVSPQSAPLLKTELPFKRFVSPFKTKFSFISKRKNTSPQILFATVTPGLSNIIHEAAQICNMPWHENRWLSGSITAAISYPSDKLVWQYLQDSTQKKISQAFSKKWGLNKENKEKSKEKLTYYNRSRWPSLLVVPDISNNVMILKEARKVGLPVIGLVNSNCQFEIDYPIFAQDQTLQSVYFFCHFLAALITKETLYTQHKRYTLQKTFSKVEKVNALTKKTVLKKEKGFSLLKAIKMQHIKEVWKGWRKPFFFQVVKPWQERVSKRSFFAKRKQVHSLLFSPRWFYIEKSRRPILKKRRFRWRYRTSDKIFRLLPRRWRKNLSAEIIAYQKKNEVKNRLYWNYHAKKKNRPRNNYKKTQFLKKSHLRFAIKKHLFQRFYGLKNFWKKPSKKQLKHWDATVWKTKSFFLMDKQKIKKEYLKKYYQKNVHTPSEKKKIYSQAKNFLEIPKLIRHYARYRYFLTKTITFAPPTNYYWKTLQQWHQNLILQNFRMLTPLLLQVRFKKKPWVSNYKRVFYPRKFRQKTFVTPWEAWKIKYGARKRNYFYVHPKDRKKNHKQRNLTKFIKNIKPLHVIKTKNK